MSRIAGTPARGRTQEGSSAKVKRKKRKTVKKALLIVHDAEEAHLIGEILKQQGTDSLLWTHAASMAAGETHLAASAIDIVLLDIDLPDAPRLEAMRRVRAIVPRVPIVLLCGPNDESKAIEAMREGAVDYLISGQIKARELMRAMEHAIERKILEDALFKERERAQITLDSIGDAVICTDLSGNISFLNPMAESLTGCPLREALGRPLAEALRLIDATTRVATPNPMAQAAKLDQRGSLPLNCVLVRRDGKEIFIEDSVAPIHDRDGLVAGSVLVFRDVTVAHALAAQIVELAERDALTGLPNRMLLNDRIGQAIARARRDKGRIAVLFLDLDGFKHTNDSLGHSIGDKLLQSVAKRLEQCVRSPDTVSRQGGDEFVVMIQELKRPEDAGLAASRMMDAVAEAHSINGHDRRITVSIGVSLYPDDGEDAETLIKNADTAMYQAKEGGRNGYRFFEPEMNLRAVERQSTEEDLRCALEQNQFALHYQPKFNLKTGAITGAEALLRWTHPARGAIHPMQFIPVAEDSGLILPIGAWVLREACMQAKAWAKAGHPFGSIAVNVSAAQFRNENFLRDLFAILGETGMDSHALELEVTESVLMKHPETTTPILRALRTAGIQVSVDDFGTGYSSLSYLQQFPIDALKIDQSFIRRIATKPDDTAIVSAIIGMGQSLHLRVIAEGVEVLEDLAFLKAHACDEAQGFYLGRPMPAEKFACLLG
jgi:diguanylate cyclase (GGDEF)-like protein/PAS domain S-box-containing protein